MIYNKIEILRKILFIIFNKLNLYRTIKNKYLYIFIYRNNINTFCNPKYKLFMMNTFH